MNPAPNPPGCAVRLPCRQGRLEEVPCHRQPRPLPRGPYRHHPQLWRCQRVRELPERPGAGRGPAPPRRLLNHQHGSQKPAWSSEARGPCEPFCDLYEAPPLSKPAPHRFTLHCTSHRTTLQFHPASVTLAPLPAPNNHISYRVPSKASHGFPTPFLIRWSRCEKNASVNMPCAASRFTNV